MSATLYENFGSPYLPRTPFFVNEKMKAKNRSKAANARNAIFCYITKSCFGREQRKKAVSNLTHFWVLVTFMCLNKVVPPSTASMGDMHTHLSRWGK